MLVSTRRTAHGCQARSFSISAPIFPWPSSTASAPTASTSSAPPSSTTSKHSTSIDQAVAVSLPSSSSSSSSTTSRTRVNPAPTSLWSTLIDSSVPPPSNHSPSAALVVPHSRTRSSPATAAAAFAARRGEGISKGSGFFTAQPTGFFSGLRANRRGFSTSSRSSYPDESTSGTSSSSDPSRPLANHPLLKDWPELISSSPAPTILPSMPRLPGMHRWEQPRRRAQRQSLTNREKASFQDMFELLFTAMKQDQEARKGSSSSTGSSGLSGSGGPDGGSTLFSPSPRSAAGEGERDSYAYTAPPGLTISPPTPAKAGHAILKNPSDLDRLYGSLTSRTRRLRGEQVLSAQTAEEVDKKSEAMSLCSSDLELLKYAMEEIFPSPSESHAPRAYPHLLATLMRTLRVKYNDPALALAVFAYARGLSVTSYAFGCTTPAYNELLRTRWEGFRNLRATLDGLEEMALNGVACDKDTRAIVEGVRRDVGGNVSPEAARMVGRMEWLVAQNSGTSPSSPASPASAERVGAGGVRAGGPARSHPRRVAYSMQARVGTAGEGNLVRMGGKQKGRWAKYPAGSGSGSSRSAGGAGGEGVGRFEAWRYADAADAGAAAGGGDLQNMDQAWGGRRNQEQADRPNRRGPASSATQPDASDEAAHNPFVFADLDADPSFTGSSVHAEGQDLPEGEGLGFDDLWQERQQEREDRMERFWENGSQQSESKYSEYSEQREHSYQAQDSHHSNMYGQRGQERHKVDWAERKERERSALEGASFRAPGAAGGETGQQPAWVERAGSAELLEGEQGDVGGWDELGEYDLPEESESGARMQGRQVSEADMSLDAWEKDGEIDWEKKDQSRF